MIGTNPHRLIAARRLALGLIVGLALGCGTTRMTDTQRTATEQLLVSNAVDQAVSSLDLRLLADKTVYLDTQYLDGTVDRGYLVSSLRQHLLANGCILQEERARATYVLEARSGGIGTDRHSLLVGIPQTSTPGFGPIQSAQIPEIPFARKTDQNGVAKVALFAYNRQTGRPVWQSGVVQALSTSKDVWVLGAGPFERGTIRRGTEFAGEPLALPSFGSAKRHEAGPPAIKVTEAAAWPERPAIAHPGIAFAGPPLLLGAPLGGVVLGATLSAPFAEGVKDARNLAGSGAASGERISANKAAAAPRSTASSTPNAGGKAETEPPSVLTSGLGFKPES
jgi:hypothetical protein